MIDLDRIRTDGGTQSRAMLNDDVVTEYADAYRAGFDMPPVILFFDKTEFWLADGFHRLAGAREAGLTKIPERVEPGTRRDAILYSLGANKAHGLRRTNADKRKAVGTMLADAEWVTWTDNKIAGACGVSGNFVGDVRRSIFNPIEDRPKTRVVERGGQTYQQDTTQIGKSAPAAAQRAPSKPVRTLTPPPPDDVGELTDADRLREAEDNAEALLEENTALRDRLAVESMDATEGGKLQASETIRELRARVVTLEAELDAVKVSRDTFMRQSGEMQKQINHWRGRAERAEKSKAAA